MTKPTPQELRDWSHVYVPRTRAALPHALIEAWNRAHPDRLYPLRRHLGTWADRRDDRAASRGP